MKTLKLLLAVLAVATPARLACGHGFSLSLTGNALDATSNDFPGNGNRYLFTAELEDLLGDLTSDHGGAGSSLFGVGKSLTFEVRGPLWYAIGDGSPAEPARDGLSMLIEGAGGTIEIDGTSTLVPGYAISGNTSHEFLWTLLDDAMAPFAPADEGVYGISYRVLGGPTGGGAPYEPSPWLVSTWFTPGFFPGNDPLAPGSPLRVATEAIYTAALAVPEPSSLALLALGGLALAVVSRRRSSVHRG